MPLKMEKFSQVKGPLSYYKTESSKSESGADRPLDAATGETDETDGPKLPQPSKTPTRKNTKKAGEGKGERRKKSSRREEKNEN